MTRRLWTLRAGAADAEGRRRVARHHGRLRRRRRRGASRRRATLAWMWWCSIITAWKRAARAGACQSQPAGRHVGPGSSLRRGRDVPVPGGAQSALCGTAAFMPSSGIAEPRSARVSRSRRARDGLRCRAADRRQSRLCARRAWTACPSCRARVLRRWRPSPKPAPPFTRLSSGIRVRAAHQCRRPRGPSQPWRRSSDRARSGAPAQNSPPSSICTIASARQSRRLILEEAIAIGRRAGQCAVPAGGEATAGIPAWSVSSPDG